MELSARFEERTFDLGPDGTVLVLVRIGEDGEGVAFTRLGDRAGREESTRDDDAVEWGEDRGKACVDVDIVRERACGGARVIDLETGEAVWTLNVSLRGGPWRRIGEYTWVKQGNDG
jgi:hypothetical protein